MTRKESREYKLSVPIQETMKRLAGIGQTIDPNTTKQSTWTSLNNEPMPYGNNEPTMSRPIGTIGRWPQHRPIPLATPTNKRANTRTYVRSHILRTQTLRAQ